MENLRRPFFVFLNWISPEKKLFKTIFAWKIFWKFFFFFENTCACVLGPWPRAFLSLASRGSVLGRAVLGLGFFLCPWPWSRALCPRLHLCCKYANPCCCCFTTRHFLWMRTWCRKNAPPQNPAGLEDLGEKNGYSHVTQWSGTASQQKVGTHTARWVCGFAVLGREPPLLGSHWSPFATRWVGGLTVLPRIKYGLQIHVPRVARCVVLFKTIHKNLGRDNS